MTFTPTDKSYTGAVTPAKVQAESSNGIKVDTTYTPEIVPVTPTTTPAETEDIQVLHKLVNLNSRVER